MIQLTSAGKRFGHKLLFEGLDWLITPQSRIGLVGANGSGKTTLLKILAGLESLDCGAITSAKGTTAGYLPQDGLTMSGRSVFAECMSVFDELRQIEQEMQALTQAMAELDPSSLEFVQVGDRFHKLEGELRARDGYAVEAQVGAVLTGLGFRKSDWTRQTEEFSGGWQMRIALAKLLLQKPNLLLLDEPTNHLDLETRNWLEEYLQAYPHAFVVISHDRYFLDVTVERIVEIWNQHVHFYPGNYDQYLAQKQQRREQIEAAYRNQKERIDQLEAFINRFRYKATKAKQVQSRIKELERMERVEVPPEEKTVHFEFPQPKASGRVVAEAEGLSKSYGGIEVFRDVQFVIERGDRIALVGPNGAGKSTLIKLLAGIEYPTHGTLKLGHNVQADYFAQDQYKELNPEARVLDDIWNLSPGRTQTELRSLLGSFLFSADDVFKPIGVLSGGERNRYALARMLLLPSNFLLMDEPTNHLDLRAKDVLLEALAAFTGTVVFVSHDRYFIDKLATRVFEIGERQVRVYSGNYEDYRRWKSAAAEAAPGASSHPEARRQTGNGIADAGGNGAKSATEDANNGSGEESSTPKPKRINPIKLRQMKERCGELEELISRAEAEIAECDTALQSFVSVEETQRQTERSQAARQRLDSLLAEWEELSLVLEGAE